MSTPILQVMYQKLRPEINRTITNVSLLSSKRVLVTLNKKQRERFITDQFESILDGAEISYLDTTTITDAAWESCLHEYRPDVLVTGWSTPALPKSVWVNVEKKPGYVCHLTGSVRHLEVREYIAAGGLVTNWGSLISHSVAEHGMLLVLAAMRNLTAWSNVEDAMSQWGQIYQFQTQSLRGRRIGIHGFGNIVRELVQLLAPFQVEISAYSEGVPPAMMQEYGVTPCQSLDDLFQQSDVLVECEALTERSRLSVNETRLNQLPVGAVFVNIGRGAVVDEVALARVARERKFRVACDIITEEPLAPNNPLLEIPGVLISPHIAGPTSELFPKCVEHAAANISRYLNGERLVGEITLAIYDRIT